MQLHCLLEWRPWNVDKWKAEAKITDGNKNTQQICWDLFEEYIHPQTSQLIAVVELKRLFQGSMSLEDFHTKALHLVKQEGYEGAAKERVLRDTIISGITSDKIRAKIVKKAMRLHWLKLWKQQDWKNPHKIT